MGTTPSPKVVDVSLQAKNSGPDPLFTLLNLCVCAIQTATMCKHALNCKLSRPTLFKWVGRLLFISVLLAQVVVLNQYLVQYANKSSFQAFTLAYTPAILLWAKGQFNCRQQEVASGVWFLYIVPLCIHSGWILGTLMSEIDGESSGLDHGFLKYPLSVTALAYMLLDAEEFEPSLHMKLNWSILVDILDFVDLLDAIIDPRKNESLPGEMHYCICAFVVVSLIILTFNFAGPVREALSNTDETNETQAKIYTIYILVQAIFINFPFLVIRLVLHYKYKAGASVFAFKNLMVIIVNFTKVRYGCCGERDEKISSNGHTPANTEDLESVSVVQSTQSSRMGDDVSSISSFGRRAQREERQRNRLFNLQDREDPEEIIVLS